jgi:hypothetical protein
VVMLHLAARRYRQAHTALHEVRPGPGGRLPFVAATAVALLGLAALAAVVAGAPTL